MIFGPQPTPTSQFRNDKPETHLLEAFTSKPIEETFNKVEGSKLEDAILKEAVGSSSTVEPEVNIVTEISVQWMTNNTSETKSEAKKESGDGNIFSKAGKAITEYLAKPWNYVKNVFQKR